MKITKQQLRRIIREVITTVDDEDFDRITMPGYKGSQPQEREQLEPGRFRTTDDAEDSAIDMVFGDSSNQRLNGDLPYEIRIVSIDGEYALYAMKNHADRYNGEGKEIAAVPRGGSIRYGRKIG